MREHQTGLYEPLAPEPARRSCAMEVRKEPEPSLGKNIFALKLFVPVCMASVNKIILVGNLGADPEIRYGASGDAICNIRLATAERWKDRASGEMKEITEWHRVVLYRRLAEIANQYLRKGALVYIEGRLRSRKWTDQAGQERLTVEVEAATMQMLGSVRDSQHRSSDPMEGGTKAPAVKPTESERAKFSGGTEVLDDDIFPF